MSIGYLFNEHFNCFDFRTITNTTTVNTSEVFGSYAF